jgi:hypothetical protein
MSKIASILHVTRSFEGGKIELADLGDITICRGVFQHRWSWEKCAQ